MAMHVCMHLHHLETMHSMHTHYMRAAMKVTSAKKALRPYAEIGAIPGSFTFSALATDVPLLPICNLTQKNCPSHRDLQLSCHHTP